MPPNGSNDLNAFLKAKVVKLKAELDVKGSMPTIKQQVDEISKKLVTKPVKLMAKLDIKLKDILPQVKLAAQQLEKHPLKLKVNIDVTGSAKNIKKQLEEVYKTVDEFNKKYGKQLEQMQERAQRSRKSASDSGNVVVPTDGLMGGFNIKQYASQLKEAERMMKETFGKGLFSSVELKDAEGNLQGFIAQLTKADGVVQKIRYSWNNDLGMFQVIDQQTVTNTEKNVQKAVNALKELEREIIKLGNEGNKFWSEYNRLQEQGSRGTLNPSLVADLKRRIKDEQVLQQEIGKENKFLFEQKKLIEDIKKARLDSKDLRKEDFGALVGQAKTAKSTDELRNIRLEMEKLLDANKREIAQEKEEQKLLKEKLKLNNEIRMFEKNVPAKGFGSYLKNELDNIKVLKEEAKTLKDLEDVRKKFSEIKTDNYINDKNYKYIQLLKRFQDIRKEFERLGLPTFRLDKDIEKYATTTERNLKDLERTLEGYIRDLKDKQKEISYLQKQFRLGTDITELVNKKIGSEGITQLEGLIKTKDIQGLQDFIGKVYDAKVATVSLRNDGVDPTGKAVTKLVTTFESAGKSAKRVTLTMAEGSKTLRQTSEEMVYNANRNLGVWEQLKIAMERVPVWMAATTAFFGTINTVRAMTDEILQLDKALTELKRVAGSNLSIDTLFQGAVKLSAELGNNVHDIMAALNDFARTFGDFNERQLLAITKTATLMSNVSDISPQEATQSLVSTMNAFNITAEESIHIVDALNQVDNDYAVSTQQLAEGLSKSASVAKTFGVSLEENIGHITAISAVTQESGAVIGNALKTIYSRITTMNEAKNALQGVGVAITEMGKNGQETVRPVSQILDDLAKKWGKLTDAQKQDIAIKVAGRYQLSRFLALMNNYDMAIQATNTATNSQGSAMRENARYMQSFEARINKLKNAFTELAKSVGDAVLSNSMMLVIEGLKSLANVAIEVTKSIGALPPVFLGMYLIANKMGVFDKIKDVIGGSIAEIQRFGEILRTEVASGAGTLQAIKTAWNGVTVAEEEAAVGARAFGFSLKSALISTGIGALVVAVGIGIEKLINYFGEQQRRAEEFQKVNDNMVKAYHEHGNSLDLLIAKYDQLKNKQNKSAQEQQEFERIQKDLAASFPTVVEYVDANGNAHLKSTDAIKKEIAAVAQLSQEQAKLMTLKYTENVEKQVQAYQDVVNKIEDLKKKRKELEESNGKIDTSSPSAMVQAKYGIPVRKDNTKEIQQNKIDVIMAEAEKTEAIKKTIKFIQEQSLAYLEANGKLRGLSDAQQAVIEKFVSSNEQILRTKGVTKETIDELKNLATDVGNVFANAFDQMSKGITDPTKLKEIKQQLDEIAKALPDDFFKLDKNRSADVVVQQLQNILNVSRQIAQGSTDLNGLIAQLQNAGLTADQAGGFVARLAREHDNAALRAQAQAQGIEEVTGALDDMNQKTIESIDATQALFGYNSKDLQAMQSHVQALQVLKQEYGENATKTQQWSDSLDQLANFLGVTKSEIASNLDHYNLVIDALSKLKYKTDEYGRTTLDLTDLNKRQKSVIEDVIKVLRDKGIQADILTGQTHKLADGEQKVANNAENMKQGLQDVNNVNFNNAKGQLQDVGKQADTASGKVTNVKNKFKDADGVNLSNAKNQLASLGNQADTTKDKVAGIKLPSWKDADGVNHATNQLTNLGNQADNAKGKTENLTNQLANAQSKAQSTLSSIQNVNQQLDQIGQKSANLNAVKNGIQGIANASQNINLNQVNTAISKVGSISDSVKGKISGFIQTLAKMASTASASGASLNNYASIINNVASAFARSAGSYNSMASSSVSALAKIKNALTQQKQIIGQLQQVISQLANLVSNAFTNMADVVKSRTNAMISTHNSQKSAIDKLTSAAQNAKKAIENLNSSARNAMATLNNYIAKARDARAAGSSVPSVPSVHANSLTNSLTIAPSSESVASSMSAFTASSGDTVGGFSGGNGGASGIVRPSIYEGGINADGGYIFTALARKKSNSSTSDPLPEKVVVDPEERLITIYDGIIRQKETILQRLTKTSAAYRDMLKQIIYYENLELEVDKKELAKTQARNEWILKRIKYLDSLKKQTQSSREEYNKLQEEYDQNLSKIANLQGEIESVTNNIRQHSIEMFTDFINEIVAKYDKAIDTIKQKISDTEFKINVLTLTQPNNMKDLLNAQIEKLNELKNQQDEESKKVSDLTNQYNSAVSKYGADSEQAKAVKDELDKAKKDLQDTTLAVLNAEKDIKDTRAKVADESIKQLQEYYKNMKSMAINAIDAEKEYLQKAHEEKMKMYDDEINKINSVYDEKLKAMDKEKAEADYQQQLNEKNTKKAELLNKISAVSRDNSLEGRKRLADLQDQLAQLDKEIADFQKAHADELLRQSIEDQKKQQIDALNAKKDEEKKSLDQQLQDLDKEKEAVSKKYDDIINNEKMWADMRDQAIKGNFTTLQTELNKMKQSLDDMNKGIFDGLTESFSSFAEEVKKQIIEMNALMVDNMIFNSQNAFDYINQLSPTPTKNPFTLIPRLQRRNPIHILPISPKQPFKNINFSPIPKQPKAPMHTWLDTSKIFDKIKEFVPSISINSIADQLATVGAINSTNNNYGDIYITIQDGDKKKATDIVKEIMVELKKKGK